MRIAEIRAREDYDRVLHATLQAYWSDRLGTDVSVGPPGHGEQVWEEHGLLSVCIVPTASRETRSFVADLFRWTRSRWRAVPQMALGSILASRFGTRFLGDPTFAVDPAIPRAESLVVLPGNHRIRIVDLATKTTQSVVKQGFSRDGLRAEIELRAAREDGRAPGPWLPVHASHETTETAWIEDPLVDGWLLPRCPPWIDREHALHAAMEQLDTWQTRTARETPVRDHAEAIREELEATLETLPEGEPGVRDDVLFAAERLAQRALALDHLVTVQSHGDLQTGNIMVRRAGGRRPGREDTVFIDWEYTRRRSQAYDALCLAFDGHHRQGLHERLGDFVEHGPAMVRIDHPAWTLMHGAKIGRVFWRRGAVALYGLEDLLWLAEDTRRGRYRDPWSALEAGLREVG